MKALEKKILRTIEVVIKAKDKRNSDLYRSPTFYYQPKRPEKK